MSQYERPRYIPDPNERYYKLRQLRLGTFVFIYPNPSDPGNPDSPRNSLYTIISKTKTSQRRNPTIIARDLNGREWHFGGGTTAHRARRIPRNRWNYWDKEIE